MSPYPHDWKVSDPAFLMSQPDGCYAPMQCLCGQYLTDEDIPCDECDEDGNLESLVKGFIVRNESLPLLGAPSVIRQVAWFHGTGNPYWENDVVASNVPVHIGEEDAALDILRPKVTLNGIGFLHTLRIRRDVTIAPFLCPDLYLRWPDNDLQDFHSESEYQAVRYVNCYESPGSISMFLDPSCLKTVDTTMYVSRLNSKLDYGQLLFKSKEQCLRVASKWKSLLKIEVSVEDMLANWQEITHKEVAKQNRGSEATKYLLQNDSQYLRTLDYLTENPESYENREVAR